MIPPNVGQPLPNFDPDVVPMTPQERDRLKKERALAKAKDAARRKEFQKIYTDGPITGRAFEAAFAEWSKTKDTEEAPPEGVDFDMIEEIISEKLPSLFDQPDRPMVDSLVSENIPRDEYIKGGGGGVKTPPKSGTTTSPAVAAAAVKTSKRKAPRPLGPNESYDASRTDKDGNVTKGVLIGGRSGKMLYSFDPVDIAANDKAKAQYKYDMENDIDRGRAPIIDKSQYQDERSRQYAALYKNGSKEQQRRRKQKSDNAATSAKFIAENKKFYADMAAKEKITKAMVAGVAPSKADLEAAGMTEEDYKNEVAFETEMESMRAKQTASDFASSRNRDKRTRRIR